MRRMTAIPVLCVVLATGWALDGMTAGKVKTPAATATLWNGPTDSIYSDGQP